MQILVTYDVSTETAAGRRRLRHVAQECENFGRRVQKSVFECRVNDMQFAKLVDRLLKWIDEKEDSLRVYFLAESKERRVLTYGIDDYVDFSEPLVT